MKKITLLFILLAVYSNIFANLVQGKWRWRNDDGTQATATWKAPQDTSIVISFTNETLRLRYELYASENSPSINLLFIQEKLQYATNTAGPWTTIDTIAGSNAFMMANTSFFVNQNDTTTQQLTGSTNAFVPGKMMVDTNVAILSNYVGLQVSELEWAIRATANTLPGTTYYFRDLAGMSNITYDSYPSLTTASVLPIKLTGFTVSRQDKKIKLEWGTASEQNNNHFEIQRSSDGQTWKTIANIKGHGTTTTSNAYTAYDENPLSGINYYVIKQFDADGRSFQSDVRSLRLLESARSIILISPNPSHSGINFSIANKAATNVDAVLTNINGRVIHHETIKSVQANAVNKLKLMQPPPGVYILKLKAEGLSESARVVVE